MPKTKQNFVYIYDVIGVTPCKSPHNQHQLHVFYGQLITCVVGYLQYTFFMVCILLSGDFKLVVYATMQKQHIS